MGQNVTKRIPDAKYEYRAKGEERKKLIAEIKRLKYEEGKTALQIATQLSASMGVQLTRSSVLGYFHREGMKHEGAAAAPRKPRVDPEKWYSTPRTAAKKAQAAGLAPAPAPRPTPRPTPRILEPVAAPSIEGVPEGARPWETRRRGECAWPYEQDRQFYSCCRPVKVMRDGSEKQYCIKHVKDMYNPAPRTSKSQEQVPRRYGRQAA